MDPEVYLKKHHVMTYIEDAIVFLLARKDEDHKTKPFDLLTGYFQSISNGTHVVFREYAFISATPYNRLAFLRVFWQSFKEIKFQELMKLADYTSLLRLHCNDFPIEIVQRVGAVVFNHGAMDDSVLSFSDFLHTLQVVFVYEYFLSKCEALWSGATTGHKTTVVVSVPSSSELGGCQTTCGVGRDVTESGNPGKESAIDLEVLLRNVGDVVTHIVEQEPWQISPSLESVHAAVGGIESLSFYDFILCLSRSDRVNKDLGVLPPRY